MGFVFFVVFYEFFYFICCYGGCYVIEGYGVLGSWNCVYGEVNQVNFKFCEFFYYFIGEKGFVGVYFKGEVVFFDFFDYVYKVWMNCWFINVVEVNYFKFGESFSVVEYFQEEILVYIFFSVFLVLFEVYFIFQVVVVGDFYVEIFYVEFWFNYDFFVLEGKGVFFVWSEFYCYFNCFLLVGICLWCCFFLKEC